MKLRRSLREDIRWCRSDRLPGQTLKRKKWIVAVLIWTIAFDWFVISFGVRVMLPTVLDIGPPYLPKRYAQEYTHISTLKGHFNDDTVFAFSPDGKTLATSWHREARLSDVETGEHLMTLETDMNQVRAFGFYPDGKTVIGVIERAAPPDGYSFAMWDLTSPGPRHPSPTRHVFLGKKHPDVPSKGKDSLTLQGNTSNDTTTVFLQDSTNVIRLGHSGSVWTLDLVQDRLVHQQVIGAKALKRMQFAAFHFATTPTDKIGSRWNWGGDRYTSSLSTIVLNRQGTRSLSFLIVPAHAAKALAFSPDGKTFTSGGYRREIRLWDVAYGEIRLWDVDTIRQIAVMPAPEGVVTALAFSPDGKILASGSSRGKILIWDLASRRLLSVIGTRGWQSALVFAPDNITLASLAEGTVRLWDIIGRTNR